MKTGILTSAAALTLALGLAGAPAWADRDHDAYGASDHHGHAYGAHGSYTGHYLRHLLRHQKEIGLTDEQVAKLKSLSLEWDKTAIKSHADTEIAERELAVLVHDDKADMSAIEAKLKQVESLDVAVKLAAIKTRRDAVALLTPEQRDKEKAEHGKMMSHWKKGGGHGEGKEHSQTKDGEKSEQKG